MSPRFGAPMKVLASLLFGPRVRRFFPCREGLRPVMGADMSISGRLRAFTILRQLLAMLLLLGTAPAFSTDYLAVCSSWSASLVNLGLSGYTSGPANNVFVGGATGVPVCVDAYGNEISPTFVAVDTASLAGLLANKPMLDWLVANQSAIQNTLNNQSTLAAQNFDPETAGQFFAWGFTGVMLVGIVAWQAGSFLGFIDRVLGGKRS